MPTPTVQTTAAAPGRVLSIDVLRGITVAFMILVNDSEDPAHSYSQLLHAEWNGFTLTDLVFPTFLFLVGASIILSLSSRIARSPTGVLDSATRHRLALSIVRRSATIFLLDLFLTALPRFHLSTLRIYGVLTRIAVCYLVVGLLCLFTRRISTLLAISAALLVGYWALLRFVPVPGFGVPTHDIPLLDPDRNLVAWLDRGVNALLQRTLHTGSLYEHTRDPEGLLSTIPALVTTIFGAITALWLRRTDLSHHTILSVPADTPDVPHPAPLVAEVNGLDPQERAIDQSLTGPTHAQVPVQISTPPAAADPARLTQTSGANPLQDLTQTPSVNQTQTHLQTQHQTLRGLLLGAAVCLLTGRLWNLAFPINKKLWTSSYVLFAAGCSLLALALCYWLVDILRLQHRSHLGRAALWPWLVFGTNAITAYAVSEVFEKVAVLIRIHDSSSPDPGRTINSWAWTYRHIFARGHSTPNTSLAFALSFVALCFLPNLLLWRKRIFLKV